MNPVAYARYLSTSTSMARLAKELHVSKQYIGRLEQGLYDAPNPVVAEWTAKVLNKNSEEEVNQDVVEELYHAWQDERRASTKNDLALKPVIVTEFDRISQRAKYGGTSDIIYYHLVFGQWVYSYWTSTHNFCVAMCLHPSPVADYIEGKTHSMPNKLRDVLVNLDLIGEGFKTHER